MKSDDPSTINHSPEMRASQRVAGILSERIRTGLYQPGQMLPTERALSTDLDVHRRSVRIAIDQLVREGLVDRRPRCRPTVRQGALDVKEGGLGTSGPRISASNLVALVMWHGGGPLEHAGTSQQRIFWGMNVVLRERGYHLVFLDIGGHHPGTEEEIAVHEAEHLRYIFDQGFGGVAFYPYAYRSNRDLALEVARRVPMVLLDRKIVGIDAGQSPRPIDFVGVENYGAMREVTRHLVDLGHRRIAYVTRAEPIASVQDRIQGYLSAIHDDSATDLHEIILTIPHYRDDRDWTVVDAVFRLPKGERPTAAVCFNDYAAVSLAERLESLGLSIPGDVALTGFDNIVPTLPGGIGLTTVAQPYEDIGVKAVELLLRRMSDRSASPLDIALLPKLIVRGSSGEPLS